MTLERLLEFDIDKLEKMSNDELLEYFKPMLKVTRPELAEKPINSKAHKTQTMQTQKQMLMAELAKRGFSHIKW